MLPVAEHAKLLASPYLASTLQRSHPSNKTVKIPRGPHNKKQTLKLAFSIHVQPFLTNGEILPGPRLLP